MPRLTSLGLCKRLVFGHKPRLAAVAVLNAWLTGQFG